MKANLLRIPSILLNFDNFIANITLILIHYLTAAKKHKKPKLICFVVPGKHRKRLIPNIDYVSLNENIRSDINIKKIVLRQYLPSFIFALKLAILIHKYEIALVIPAYNPLRFRFFTIKSLIKLKNSVRNLVILWLDSLHDSHIKKIEIAINCATVHIVCDDPALTIEKLIKKNNFKPIFFPFPVFPSKSFQRKILENDKREIDVFFSGTADKKTFWYARRLAYIEFLEKNNIRVQGYKNLEFGQNVDKIPNYKNYLDCLSRTKIALSFSWHHGKEILPGRIWEAIASGALLVHTRGVLLNNILSENIDYVAFDSEIELLEKIEYYLNNQQERLKIINAAREKLINMYNSELLLDLIWYGKLKNSKL